MLATIIVICGVMMVIFPKYMQAIVIMTVLAYAFPGRTLIVILLAGFGYQLYKRYNPFK